MQNVLKIKLNPFVLNVFLGSILAMFVFLSMFINLDQDSLEFYFNSDTLYIPAIYHDLFIDQVGLTGWELSPSPYFFPDMPFYFLFYSVTHNIPLADILYGALQYFFILFLVYRIAVRTLKVNYRIPFLISMMFSLLIFIPGTYSEEFVFSFYIFSKAYHLSCFTMSLLCYLLTIRFLQNRNYWNLFFVLIISVLTIVSDRLFIVTFIFPMTAALIVMILKNKSRSIYLKPLVVNILSLLSGMIVFNSFRSTEIFKIGGTNEVFAIQNIPDSLNNFIGVFQYWFRNPMMLITIIIILLSFILTVLVVLKKTDNNKRLYSWFFLFFFIIVLFAPVLNGRFTDIITTRYNISAFYFAIFNVFFLSSLIFIKKERKVNHYVFMVLFTGLILFFSLNFGLKNLKNGFTSYINYYPEEARKVDELSEKHELKSGVASFWVARKAMLFSKKGIRVLAVHDDLSILLTNSNKRWFTHPENRKFNFIITNKSNSTDALIKTFGDDAILIENNHLSVYLTPDFHYSENDRTLNF